MLPMRSDRWYSRSARSLIILLLVMVSGLLPTMAQAAPNASASYHNGYNGDDEADDACVAYYYVHHGDTLSRIAARFGVSVYAIAHVNGIHNVNWIYPGQYFCIPAHDAHEWYDEAYRYQHDDYEGYQEEDGYGYGERHEDDGYRKHGYHDAAEYGYHETHDDYAQHEYANAPVEEEYADPGYYRTSGGHTGVCYYPDPRYNPAGAEFYETDERPDCS